MHADEKLDLCGIPEPYCLLMCKSALIALRPGAVLEIQLRDPATLQDLVTILGRSGDTVIGRDKRGDCYRIWVQKVPSG
jgi:TusA-related sulfurtransferase